MKHEFEEKLGSQVTEEKYKDIEFVYTFHPSISNTEGKTQIAQLYKLGGIRLIRDMIPTARKAAERKCAPSVVCIIIEETLIFH